MFAGAYRRLYEAVYRRSLDRPEEFWGEAAEDIHWFKRWDKVMDDTKSPFTQWYVERGWLSNRPIKANVPLAFDANLTYVPVTSNSAFNLQLSTTSLVG
jgi:Acetyl-coenzyme A synthetase N-terminus